MKNINFNQMENTRGGFACVATNPGQGIGQCFPTLCLFVGGILASNPSQATVFEVCPL